MSFILDALKKSESDRQRQNGPALFEVRVATPKSRFPLWAVAIAVLLGVNMIVVGWLLLRRASHAADAQVSASSAEAVVPASPVAAYVPTQPAPVPATPSAGAQPPSMPAAQPGSVPTTQPGSLPAAQSGLVPTTQPVLLPAAPGAPAPQLTSTRAIPPLDPADYEPATDPGPPPPLKGRVRLGTESGVALYQDAALAPGANLPQLHLDLHAYDSNPQNRFALINMHKVREGDYLPEGIKVESITQDGVVMSHNGSKFLLTRD